jgi:hypothetical protein
MWHANFPQENPMTIRPKLILELFAVFVSVASCPSFAQNQAAVTPDTATTVTTTGGTANRIAKFSGSNTIVNSILYDNGTAVGIGTTTPTATLTVDGAMTITGTSVLNGQVLLPSQGTATASEAFNSQFIKLSSSAFNSSSMSVVSPRFQLQVEPTGNDTASPNGTLNLLASATASTPVETGFFINTNGTIHFAPGQTFPGGGPFCIATAGGFGSGGTTFVGPGFTVPAENNCAPWSGFTKTASTVILTTNGAACLSSTGKTLTVSVSSADPDFLGAGTQASDYIQLTRTSSTGSFTGGTDQGEFAGSADQVTCTSSVLSLPDSHD